MPPELVVPQVYWKFEVLEVAYACTWGIGFRYRIASINYGCIWFDGKFLWKYLLVKMINFNLFELIFCRDAYIFLSVYTECIRRVFRASRSVRWFFTDIHYFTYLNSITHNRKSVTVYYTILYYTLFYIFKSILFNLIKSYDVKLLTMKIFLCLLRFAKIYCKMVLRVAIINYYKRRLSVFSATIESICERPPAMVHSRLIDELPAYNNETVRVECDEGFVLSQGSRERTQSSKCLTDHIFYPDPVKPCQRKLVELWHRKYGIGVEMI